MALAPIGSPTRMREGIALMRDGVHIAFTLRDAGEGAPRLALVHSLAMDRSFWNPVADRLAGRASVLSYDCRGHGASAKPEGPYTVEQFADDLADLCDHVGWRSLTVAGASMGGCVALAFALRHAARTEALGLIDTTAAYDAMPAWRDRAVKAQEHGLASLVDFQLARWFGDGFRAANPDVVEACVAVFLRNDVAAYAECCRMLGACDLRPALAAVRVPTAVLVGAEDHATPVAMAEVLHRGIAGATLTVLSGARHLTPLERPHEVAAELEALLRRRHAR